MFDTRKIFEALGLRQYGTGSLLALSDLIDAGLPMTCLERVRRLVSPSDNEIMDMIVSRSTRQRRKRKGESLSSYESERLVRVVEVWLFAVEVYKTGEMARRFLWSPHMMLSDRLPITVASRNAAGAYAVMQLLGRLQYGSAA